MKKMFLSKKGAAPELILSVSSILLLVLAFTFAFSALENYPKINELPAQIVQTQTELEAREVRLVALTQNIISDIPALSVASEISNPSCVTDQFDIIVSQTCQGHLADSIEYVIDYGLEYAESHIISTGSSYDIFIASYAPIHKVIVKEEDLPDSFGGQIAYNWREFTSADPRIFVWDEKRDLEFGAQPDQFTQYAYRYEEPFFLQFDAPPKVEAYMKIDGQYSLVRERILTDTIIPLKNSQKEDFAIYVQTNSQSLEMEVEKTVKEILPILSEYDFDVEVTSTLTSVRIPSLLLQIQISY